MTATEKYNSVLEGSMAKGEFLRQMKQAFPQYLTVSNGFDDSVQILKNRGMISENKLKDVFQIVRKFKKNNQLLLWEKSFNNWGCYIRRIHFL